LSFKNLLRCGFALTYQEKDKMLIQDYLAHRHTVIYTAANRLGLKGLGDGKEKYER